MGNMLVCGKIRSNESLLRYVRYEVTGKFFIAKKSIYKGPNKTPKKRAHVVEGTSQKVVQKSLPWTPLGISIHV